MAENLLIDNKFLGIRLRNARKEAGLTRSELAKLLGVSAQTIYRYEKGEINFSVDFLLKVARLLNKNFLWFIGEEENDKNAGPERMIDNLVTPGSFPHRIPIVRKIIKEGLHSIANINDYLNLFTKNEADVDFAWIVQGDHMEPFLLEGDAVACKSVDFSLHENEILASNNLVVFVHDDEESKDVVRYLLKDETGRYRLRASNPKYDDIYIDDPQSRIIGIVVQVIKQPGQYKETPAGMHELMELGFTGEDIKNDPAIRKALMIVGRAKEKLSDEAKESMAEMLAMWYKTLEAQEKKLRGE